MKLELHGSKLDSYGDCHRLGMASMFPEKLRQAGYEVRTLTKWVTPLIGTAIHAGVELMHKHYIDTGVMPDASILAGSFEHAIDKFNKILISDMMNGEVRMTTKFASNEIIAAHIKEYLEVYYHTILPENKAKLSELKFDVELMPGVKYVSSLDNFTTDGVLRDLKTGAKITPAYHQMGVYVYLLRDMGEEVRLVQLDYMIRPRDGAKPEHKPIRYDPDVCMNMAKYMTAKIINDVTEFEKTGDINVFTPNPRSEACNMIMCSLWGTSSCGGWEKL